MTKLLNNKPKNAVGGYVRHITTLRGQNKYFVIDDNTDEILGTFDTHAEALRFQADILLNM